MVELISHFYLLRNKHLMHRAVMELSACIKVLGKADIIFSFALSQLLLNIDKKVKLMIFLFSQVSLWLLFGFFIIVESMLHLTGKNLLKVFFCITITQ